MQNIVIFGAGKRVRETIIPSIFLNQAFYIKQIITRNSGNKVNIIFNDKELSYKTSSLEELDLININHIYIGINPEEINNIIEFLTSKFETRKIILIIDTPPIYIKNIFKIRNFSKFKNVLVMEDWPSILTSKIYEEFVNKKLLGDLKNINFYNSSYKYHTLSLLRKLFKLNNFSIIIKRSHRANFSTNIFSGLKIIANIKEPRNYNQGKINLVGTKGTISDYKIKSKNKFDNFILDYEISNNKFIGINIFLNGKLFKKYPIIQNFNLLHKQRGNEIHKILKIISVSEIFADIEANKFDNKYNLENAIYDYLAYFILDKIGIFVDLSIPFKKVSILNLLIKLILIRNVF